MKNVKKLLSLIMAMLMLMGTLCINVSADDTSSAPAPVTVTAKDDTYVSDKGVSDNNYVTSNQLLVQKSSPGYQYEAYVKFNLSSVEIPDGYEIDTATFIGNTVTTWGGATQIDLFTIPADTKFNEVTFNTKPTLGTTAIGSTTLATPKAPETFNIDITDYIKNLDIASDDIAIAIMNTGGMSYISSLEGDAALVPKITITFVKTSDKIVESTLEVKEVAAFDLSAAGKAETTTTAADVIYTPIANAGTAGYTLLTRDEDIDGTNNRSVMMSFDLSGMESSIPEGKVIKSATLYAYITQNWATQGSVVEAIGVSDTSFTAATATMNNKPSADEGYIGHDVIEGARGSSLNEWVTIDITPYFTSHYYGEKTDLALALQLSNISASNSLQMAAYKEGGENNPYIKLEYDNDKSSEGVTYGETKFYQSKYNTPVDALSTGRVIVEVPVTYQSSTAKSCDIYLAAYGAESNALLWVGKQKVSFASTNGSSVTAIFDVPTLSENYTWKAFMWDTANVKNLNTAATINAPQN